MKTIANVVLTFLVLFVGWKLFPENVCIDNLGVCIIAVLLIWAVGTVIALAESVIAGLLFCNCQHGAISIAIVAIGIAVSVYPLTLFILNLVLPGFCIKSIITYILLTIAFLLFQVHDKKEQTNY